MNDHRSTPCFASIYRRVVPQALLRSLTEASFGCGVGILCVWAGLLRWKSLVEAAVDPSRDDVNPNKHRNVDLISTLLLKLQLIDDRDGRCAEHEINPYTSKQS